MLSVFTVQTRLDPNAFLSQHSASKVEVPITILGAGNEKLQRWSGEGLQEKLLYQAKFVEREVKKWSRMDFLDAERRAKLLSRNLLMYVDGQDVLFEAGDNEILERYGELRSKNSDCTVFFSGQPDCSTHNYSRKARESFAR